MIIVKIGNKKCNLYHVGVYLLQLSILFFLSKYQSSSVNSNTESDRVHDVADGYTINSRRDDVCDLRRVSLKFLVAVSTSSWNCWTSYRVLCCKLLSWLYVNYFFCIKSLISVVWILILIVLWYVGTYIERLKIKGWYTMYDLFLLRMRICQLFLSFGWLISYIFVFTYINLYLVSLCSVASRDT